MTPNALSKRFCQSGHTRPTILLGCLFFLSGCSSSPTVVTPARDVQQEEKFLLLQEKVRERESEIGRLTAAVEALKARADFPQEGNSESSTAQIERKMTRVKLSPKPPTKPTVAAEEDDTLGNEESVSLADSRHESLHWYFRGLTLLEQGQFDSALESFGAFLKASPHHVYADRAQYWIGEAHFRAKEYGLALIAMNRLESEFPLSFRATEASWKKALTLENLGRSAEAVVHLKEFLRRFPRHPMSPLASNKLASLEMSLGKANP